ncbi:response regulator [Mesorhizobium sp. M2A.F.Ca.ET.037.01.1.1]|uniref:response regulator n=3 Tax=Mesorhizobium TaxID=68287 RepID=UPI000FCB2B88|nr:MULTISPECIES: response regulator [unclassified Mesorhizobium]RUY09079.1 response regulator [Mesorhizobium sp. M2A.F.Ca.ET.040.01.1.1]RVC66441.1 response regulator [Mesorhizobium sp. M00.F.Ca.ET.038.03.1.1]RUX16216.1 response regulator [Mesorhizobium sp. M2A.F.Ca.ET.037.01.1.1]RWA85643.1 MAG: response regulator [Mesorhizobium sp.]RWE97402.1 MAG: response regulator [Mesorhizobium sp.]
MQKTILIVEDEFIIAMDLKVMLERLGWRVLGPVARVAHALRLLEDELPTVALLDVNLGDHLVTPVAEALRGRGVPFAVASAYDKPELFGGAVLVGVPNVGKPTSEWSLLEVLPKLSPP